MELLIISPGKNIIPTIWSAMFRFLTETFCIADMNIYYLVISLLLNLPDAPAQQSLVKYISTEKIIGNIFIDNRPVVAKEFLFEDRIHDLHLNEEFGVLTIQFRDVNKAGDMYYGKSKIAGFDLLKGNFKWERKLPNNSYVPMQIGNILLIRESGQTRLVNGNTGLDYWKTAHELYYIDPEKKIALGYKMPATSQNKLYAFDLKSGKKIWERKISNAFNWNSIDMLEDSTLLLVAAGLHRFNINTGEGWSADFKTGQVDYQDVIITKADGMTDERVTGGFMYSAKNNTLTDAVSNVFIEDSTAYISNRDHIKKFNMQNGSLIWQKSLPKNMASKSVLFTEDSLLFQLNLGYANTYYTHVLYGRPFLSCYNKNSGELIYEKAIPSGKFYIRDYIMEGQYLFLLSRNKVFQFDLNKGNQLGETTIDVNKADEEQLMGFVGSHVFEYNHSGLPANLMYSDIHSRYVFSNKNQIYHIDNNNNLIRVLGGDSIYAGQTIYNDFQFISNDAKTLVLDSEGYIAAELNCSGAPVLFQNKLYFIRDKIMLEINLDQFSRLK